MGGWEGVSSSGCARVSILLSTPPLPLSRRNAPQDSGRHRGSEAAIVSSGTKADIPQPTTNNKGGGWGGGASKQSKTETPPPLSRIFKKFSKNGKPPDFSCFFPCFLSSSFVKPGSFFLFLCPTLVSTPFSQYFLLARGQFPHSSPSFNFPFLGRDLTNPGLIFLPFSVALLSLRGRARFESSHLDLQASNNPPPPQFGGRIWPILPNWSAELLGF